MLWLMPHDLQLVRGRPPGQSVNVIVFLLFLVPARGPTVTKVIPVNATVLEVAWNELRQNETNGNITMYTVCYQVSPSPVGICDKYRKVGAESYVFNLTGLNEGTTYKVAVQAETRAGPGPTGSFYIVCCGENWIFCGKLYYLACK